MRPTIILFTLLCVSLYSYAQPDIIADSNTLSTTLEPGTADVLTFTISNSGTTDLEVELEFVNHFAPGEVVNFTKENFAVWTIPSNQDRITENVWIARQDVQSLFNAKVESSGSGGSGAPTGTVWAVGDVNEIDPNTLTTFQDHQPDGPQSLIGLTTTMYLVEDEQWYNVEFSSYTGGNNGGGFAYTRTRMFPWISTDETSGIIAPGETAIVEVTLSAYGVQSGTYNGAIWINSNDPDQPQIEISTEMTVLDPPILDFSPESIEVTLAADSQTSVDFTIENDGTSTLLWTLFETVEFSKPGFADWTQEEFQDRITENVWITRADTRGIFNIAREPEYDRSADTAPEGTEWALGLTRDVFQFDNYGTWRSRARNRFTNTDFSMHLIEDDLYYDVNFSVWSQGRNGGAADGAFTYTRTETSPWLDADVSEGELGSGESITVSLLFDSNGFLEGTYHYDLRLRTNDPMANMVIIPVTLHVDGDANINTTDGEDFGDVLIGNIAVIDEIDITNNGTADLVISNVAVSNDQFNTSLGDLTLAPGESEEYEIIFDPDVEGVSVGTITFETNDPDFPIYTIVVEGEGVLPPAISVSSFSFTQTLEGGAIAMQTLTLENTGDSNLEFELGLDGVFLVDENNVGIGADVFFEKGNFADVNDPENQDWITPGVILTRGDNRNIFNIAIESSADRNTSPLGTEWAIGNTGETQTSYGPFVNLRNEIDGRFSNLPGTPLSMHLIEEDIFLDVEFVTWTTSNSGGGFSYIRSGLESWLEISETQGIIEPGQSMDLVLYFDAAATLTGTYNGTIDIFTNVPTEPELQVQVQLDVTSDPPPTVNISVTSLDVSVAAGNTTTGSFTIENTGDRELEWSIFLENVILRDENGKALGPNVTITKPDNADWNLPEFQDRITDNVWITRQNSRGIYNIAQEVEYNRSTDTAPADTEWALGSTSDVAGGYTTWRNHFRSNFNTPELVGQTSSLHLITDDLYYDIDWLSWTQGNNGGGFSYRRTELVQWMQALNPFGVLGPGETVTVDFLFDASLLNGGEYNADIFVTTSNPLQPIFEIPANLTVTGEQDPEIVLDPTSIDVALEAGNSMTQTVSVSNVSNMTITISAVFSNDPETFTKEDFADWRLPENQDRISENVWITRANDQGLFNAVLQDGYSNNGPLNTLWARGTTANPSSNYTDWRNAVGRIGQTILGPTFSMYLTQEDVYYDVKFDSWTRGRNGGNGGGGFSYTRRLVPDWLTITSNQTFDIGPGETVEVGLLIDGTNLVGGTYTTNFFFNTGSVIQPSIPLPIEVTVTGTPNIDDTSPLFDLGEGFVDFDNEKHVEIVNSGTDDIIITNVVSNNSAFTPVETSVTIRGQETYLLPITFSPDAVDVFQGSLTISNNDAETPELVVELFALGVGIPGIELSDNSITIDIVGNNVVPFTVTITNTGTSDLIWEGDIIIPDELVVFEKPNDADWTLEENQDRITETVWITRAATRGLFNIAREDSYNDDTETPAGTLWAEGSSIDVSMNDYESWRDAVDGDPPRSVGGTYSLLLTDENLVFDVVFTFWQSGDESPGGGGFAYTRQLIPNWIDAGDPELIVPAGESIDLVLLFDGVGRKGTFEADIIIETNIPESDPLIINTVMNVTGAPDIQEIDDIEFGEVFVGGNSIIEVEVYNNGNEILEATDISSDVPEFTINPSSGSIEPFDMGTIDVIYTPTALTANTGTITITSNDPNNPMLSFQATGRGISGPTFELTPDESFLATTVPGGQASKTYTITNSGSVPLDWELIDVFITDGPEVTFTKADFADWLLPENQDRITDNVWITRADTRGIFNIAREEEYDRSADTAPEGTRWYDGSTFDALVNDGIYTTWRSVARGNFTDNVFSMHLLEDDLFFDVEFHQWTERSGGGFSYTRRQIPTWIDVSDLSGTVDGGESQDITVILDAENLTGGTYRATLVFGSNLSDDGSESIETEVTVLGTPEISVEQTDIAFGEVFVNNSESMDLIIQNIGDGDLNISNITFDEDVFSTDETTFMIPSESELVIPIDFMPTAVQAYTGNVTITHDDPVNTDPIVVALTGEGVDPPIMMVDQTELSAALFFGETNTQSFTIANTGGSDLIWNFGAGGEPVTFTKEDFADWTLAENQDRITDNVWITRQDTRGIFNIAREDDYDRTADTAPEGTEWADGYSADADPDDYTTWRNVARDRFTNNIFSMHLIEDDLFFDVLFHQWTNGDNSSGGGFSYTRWPAFGEVSWVAFSATSGVIAPGGSQTVEVVFNPLGQTDGSFSMDLQVQSNDEASGPHDIAISLSVSGLLVVNPIEDQLVNEGFNSTTIDISNVFADAQNDPLNLTAMSSDAMVVTPSISDNTLTITEVGTGTSVITLSADDGKGSDASQEFDFRVNAIPTVANALDNLTIFPGFGTETIDISNVFNDVDGDDLTLSVMSSNEAAATAEITDSNLVLTEGSETGSTTVTITADDSFGGTVTESFDISIILGLDPNVIASMVLYPNPTRQNSISLQLDGIYLGKIKTRIIDITGKVVLRDVLNKKESKHFADIDLSKLRSGNYILELTTAEGRILTRFVKE